MRLSSLIAVLGTAAFGLAQTITPGEEPLQPIDRGCADELLIPDCIYLNTQNVKLFETIVDNIIYAQQLIKQESPEANVEFEESISLWLRFAQGIQHYSNLKQHSYMNALEGLRQALWTLRRCDLSEYPHVRYAMRVLLDNNLYLVGFFNNVYGSEIVPEYIIDLPGEILSATLHFLQIDVTKPLPTE